MYISMYVCIYNAVMLLLFDICTCSTRLPGNTGDNIFILF